MTDALTRLSTALADRYKIERELGAGGMATVYLAQDLKHDRQVALKVLKPELAAVLGADRFVQEIKTTAALQHPHILPLFDSGTADGFLYYVMPYVEGETLRDRLNHETQLGIEEAVKITTEVADALDYAHRHGVIHRDIKPENILLHDGRPMVADFGIALALSAAAGGRMTETGMSLGTPHYMSPEQATAEKELTNRSDIYSLGCVLYEMLTGNPPHVGSSAQQIIMRIVTEDAEPVTKLRKSVPANVAAALVKALERLPADRFESARAFAEALGNPAYTVATTAGEASLRAPGGARAGWRARVRDPYVLVPSLLALAFAGAFVASRGRAPSTTVPPIRFVLTAADSVKPVNFFPWPAAISPDGSMVVYSAARSPTSTMFYLLRTDQLDARPIPGTTNAYQPYFSPDGQWLAFEMAGKERKVRLDGSAPVAIVDANGANGADWMVGDEIVLGAQGHFHGLSYVNAAGGAAVGLTQPDTAKGERDHLWPIGLPDGKTVVFTMWFGTLATSRLAMTSLDDGRVTPLDLPGIRPLAVVDGVLVYVQSDGAVMAVPIDARAKRVTGRPIPVHDPVPVAPANNGNAGIFLSRGGALVTSRGGARGRLSWISTNGQATPVLAQAGAYEQPRLSPDERRIALIAEMGSTRDVWIYDRSLSTFSRLTSKGTVTSVDWSPDGSHVLYTAASETARGGVWLQAASGGSPPKELFEVTDLTPSAALSPDGQSLLLSTLRGNSWDILRVSLDSDRVARPYLATPEAQEASPRFAPDGKWVAVISDESGRYEVYVRSFPDPTARIQVSVNGGQEPAWSRDGTRLYYRAGSALIAARVSFTPVFTLLARDTVLSNAGFAAAGFFGANYDVSRDRTRVLSVVSDADDFELVVSPNWITELRRRLAESRGRQ
jgi:serine/threonine-protein kinase